MRHVPPVTESQLQGDGDVGGGGGGDNDDDDDISLQEEEEAEGPAPGNYEELQAEAAANIMLQLRNDNDNNNNNNNGVFTRGTTTAFGHQGSSAPTTSSNEMSMVPYVSPLTRTNATVAAKPTAVMQALEPTEGGTALTFTPTHGGTALTFPVDPVLAQVCQLAQTFGGQLTAADLVQAVTDARRMETERLVAVHDYQQREIHHREKIEQRDEQHEEKKEIAAKTAVQQETHHCEGIKQRDEQHEEKKEIAAKTAVQGKMESCLASRWMWNMRGCQIYASTSILLLVLASHHFSEFCKDHCKYVVPLSPLKNGAPVQGWYSPALHLLWTTPSVAPGGCLLDTICLFCLLVIGLAGYKLLPGPGKQLVETWFSFHDGVRRCYDRSFNASITRVQQQHLFDRNRESAKAVRRVGRCPVSRSDVVPFHQIPCSLALESIVKLNCRCAVEMVFFRSKQIITRHRRLSSRPCDKQNPVGTCSISNHYAASPAFFSSMRQAESRRYLFNFKSLRGIAGFLLVMM